jgi:hypothetical protein
MAQIGALSFFFVSGGPRQTPGPQGNFAFAWRGGDTYPILGNGLTSRSPCQSVAGAQDIINRAF